MNLTHYDIEVINMVLNVIMTGQLGILMYWTVHIYLYCLPPAGRSSQRQAREPNEQE
jgi:hypothetical protein